MRPERGDSFPGPAIAMAGYPSVSIEDTRNQIIIDDQNELPHRCDNIGRSTVALPAATLGQAQFGMDAANPMDQQGDLGGFTQRGVAWWRQQAIALVSTHRARQS